MSELSAKLAALKGEQTTSEIIQKAGLSRETFRKMERGEGVKLTTLRQIFEALDCEESEWVDLLIAWIQTEIGPESARIWIHSREPSALKEGKPDIAAQAMAVFQKLNAVDRDQVLKTMQRREVLNCLPAINQVWEKTDRTKPKATGPQSSRFSAVENPSSKTDT
jgi:DNA-binding Xre family transcriptional regulator